jgi:hypothetical protein
MSFSVIGLGRALIINDAGIFLYLEKGCPYLADRVLTMRRRVSGPKTANSHISPKEGEIWGTPCWWWRNIPAAGPKIKKAALARGLLV